MSAAALFAPWQEEAGDLDEAGPVGSAIAWINTSACRVRSDGDALLFDDEEPIRYRHQVRSVGRRPAWRLEIKCVPGRLSAGDEIVVTEHPYGAGWVGSAPLKRGSHKGAHERLDLDDREWAEVCGLLLDPWEKGQALTAGIELPTAGTPPSGTSRDSRDARWVFGVCAGLEECQSRMLESAEAARLVTAQRVVCPGPHGTAHSIPIHERVKEERSTLLVLAVRQALAGPVDPVRGAGESWRGRAVMELVARIYFDHLLNRTKQERRRDG